jgi:hypothetical protein
MEIVMEIKLTPEQIELARQCLAGRCGFSHLDETLKELAATLQSPWELPTLNEANRVHDDLRTMSTCDALSLFVNRRNADILPSIHKPGREKLNRAGFEPKEIIAILAEIIAILAALDLEVKP